MIFRLVLLVCFLCIFSQTEGSNIPSQVKSPFNELPCIVLGGTCTAVGKGCPAGKHVTTKGLCPYQEEKGVQCCHSVPKDGDTCHSHGGECIDASSRCPENLTYRKAIDCSKKQKCCILV